MNKFNLESAKFVSIIIGICFIFVMVIWHAFDYLPDKTSNVINLENEVSIKSEDVKDEASSQEVGEIATQDEQDSEEEIREENTYSEQELSALEPILDENAVRDEEVQENSLNQTLNRAKGYMQENKITNAISEYQKAVSMTEDVRIKAECYEEIALIYANQKRYGSALSLAQKAYNTSPSTSREMLLARLYYKTGDIDKATNRVNNILRRDFLLNDK